MHRERKITVNVIHLSRGHIVIDHLLQSIVEEVSAGRALIIAENFHCDGSVLVSESFYRRGGNRGIRRSSLVRLSLGLSLTFCRCLALCRYAKRQDRQR